MQYGARYEGFRIIQEPMVKWHRMSTAIVRVFNGDRFIIGADGRQTKGADDVLVTNALQKIFPINDENKLAYSICGSTIRTGENGVTIWNLHEQIRIAAAPLYGHGLGSLTAYAESLAGLINRVFFMKPE
jgi:hypothetical protein